MSFKFTQPAVPKNCAMWKSQRRNIQGLNCLRQRGMMVLFGQTGGRVPAVDPAILGAKGFLFLTRPSLAHYAAVRKVN